MVLDRNKYLRVVKAYVAKTICSIEFEIDDEISKSMRQRVTKGNLVTLKDVDENGNPIDLYDYITANNLTAAESNYVRNCVVKDYNNAGWTCTWTDGEFKLGFQKEE